MQDIMVLFRSEIILQFTGLKILNCMCGDEGIEGRDAKLLTFWRVKFFTENFQITTK